MSDEVVTEAQEPVVPKSKQVKKVSEKRFVDSSTKLDDLIQWDEDGDTIFFTDDVPDVPKIVLEKLSKLTLVKYNQAVEIANRLAKEDPAAKEINKHLKVSQSSYASPRDIAFGNKAKKGLKSRLVREDRVGTWEARGYVMAKPEHMVEAKMRQVEGHFEHGTLGAPKEYLMVTSEENQRQLAKLRDEKREAIDAAQVADIEQKAHDAGLKGIFSES